MKKLIITALIVTSVDSFAMAANIDQKKCLERAQESMNIVENFAIDEGVLISRDRSVPIQAIEGARAVEVSEAINSILKNYCHKSYQK